MKRILVSMIALFATSSALAFGGVNVPTNMLTDSPSNFPSESGWAKAMTQQACGVDLVKSDEGVIEETDNGVIYSVYSQGGELVAQAWASSKFIWAKKSCLN